VKRDKLNDHEARIRRLEDSIDYIGLVVFAIIIGIILFIVFSEIPRVIEWYNGLSEFGRGEVDGAVLGIFTIAFFVFFCVYVRYLELIE